MIEDWNIDGIAKNVLKEMSADQATTDAVDDYVYDIAYRTVFSRLPSDATVVAELVKKKVMEALENE